MVHQRRRLSDEDKRILYHLQFIGDRSIAELASELRVRENSLQSKVARWERDGAVAQRVFINSFSIGISEVEVFFTPTKKSKRDQAELVKTVGASPGICWFYRTAGKHDFILGIEAPSMAHITRHLEELDSKRDGIFSVREIGVSIGYWWFGRKYLAPADTGHECCLCHLPTDEVKVIDAVDHHILRAVGQTGALSHRELARELDLPQSTVGYRISNMVKRGIIAGMPYFISPVWLGMLVYRLQLVFTSFSASTHKSLLRWSQQNRSVVSMMRLLGPWDYTLRCEVARPEEIADLTDELHEVFGSVLKECSIISVVRQLSSNFYPIESFSE